MALSMARFSYADCLPLVDVNFSPFRLWLIIIALRPLTFRHFDISQLAEHLCNIATSYQMMMHTSSSGELAIGQLDKIDKCIIRDQCRRDSGSHQVDDV